MCLVRTSPANGFIPTRNPGNSAPRKQPRLVRATQPSAAAKIVVSFCVIDFVSRIYLSQHCLPFCSAFMLSSFFRHILADLLKMKVDDPVFEHILSKLPSDDGWKEDDMLEAAYKEVGLQRYCISTCMGMVKKTQKDTEKSEFATSSSSAGKHLAIGTGASSCSSDVKVEVKAHAILVADTAVVSAAEKRMSKLLAELKGHKAALSVVAKTTESQNLCFEALNCNAM